MNEGRDGKIRYFWVDEDGTRISPIHSRIWTALEFINSWKQNLSHLDRQINKDEGQNSRLTRLTQAREKMMISGKPPIKLRRLVTTHTVEGPTEAEDKLVKALYSTEFGDSE